MHVVLWGKVREQGLQSELRLISNKPNYTKTERQGKAEVVSSRELWYPRNTSVTAYDQQNAETPALGDSHVIHSKTVMCFTLNETNYCSIKTLVSAICLLVINDNNFGLNRRGSHHPRFPWAVLFYLYMCTASCKLH